MLHIIIKIYVFLRRKTENIFVFIAPFLCVISLSCWFQVDLGETRSLLRTSLTIMWLKVYLLKLTCQVCMFYIIQQCLICSSYSSPKCGDENTRISLWKNTLFLCFFFCLCFDKIISKNLLEHFLERILVQMLLFFSGLEVTFWINLSF